MFVINEVVNSSPNGRKFFKAEGIEILERSVMEKFIKINKTEASDKKIPKYLYIVNQSKVPRITI